MHFLVLAHGHLAALTLAAALVVLVNALASAVLALVALVLAVAGPHIDTHADCVPAALALAAAAPAGAAFGGKVALPWVVVNAVALKALVPAIALA